MKTITVSRKKWGRGKEGGGELWDPTEGTMCCLGFLARQCGVSARAIKWIGAPNDLSLRRHAACKFTKELKALENPWSLFVLVNDDTNITDKRRESKLMKLAEKFGFRFKFVP